MNISAEVETIKRCLQSNVPAVRKKGINHLEYLIAQQRRLLNKEDRTLRELVQLLYAAPVHQVNGKMQATHFSDTESEVRYQFQRTLNAMSSEEAKQAKQSIANAMGSIDAERRRSTEKK